MLTHRRTQVDPELIQSRLSSSPAQQLVRDNVLSVRKVGEPHIRGLLSRGHLRSRAATIYVTGLTGFASNGEVNRTLHLSPFSTSFGGQISCGSQRQRLRCLHAVSLRRPPYRRWDRQTQHYRRTVMPGTDARSSRPVNRVALECAADSGGLLRNAGAAGVALVWAAAAVLHGQGELVRITPSWVDAHVRARRPERMEEDS